MGESMLCWVKFWAISLGSFVFGIELLVVRLVVVFLNELTDEHEEESGELFANTGGELEEDEDE